MLTQTAAARVTVGMARAAFVASLDGLAELTRATYATNLGRFLDFLAAQGHDVAHLTTDQLDGDVLEAFYLWLVRRYGGATPTVLGRLAAAKAFLRFLDRRGWLAPGLSYTRLQAQLAAVVKPLPRRTKQVGDEPAQVVRAALRAPEPDTPVDRLLLLRDRALLLTFFCTGMRIAEVVRLSRADVRDGRATQALILGKGQRERVAFFDQPTRQAIQTYLAARTDRQPALFLGHTTRSLEPGRLDRRLTIDGARARVEHWAARAGVRVTPHLFRHLKARTLLDQGAEITAVQEILGHASPTTTKQIYAPYTKQRLRQAFDAFSRSVDQVIAAEAAATGEAATPPATAPSPPA